MNATNYYVSTTRLVLQADPDSPPSWQDLYTALPTLRNSLSCTVCENLLSEPYTPEETTCEHHVCKSCKGGVKKLRPTCSWCKDYSKYSENVQLRILLENYKKLCGLIKITRMYWHILRNPEQGPIIKDIIAESEGEKIPRPLLVENVRPTPVKENPPLAKVKQEPGEEVEPPDEVLSSPYSILKARPRPCPLPAIAAKADLEGRFSEAQPTPKASPVPSPPSTSPPDRAQPPQPPVLQGKPSQQIPKPSGTRKIKAEAFILNPLKGKADLPQIRRIENLPKTARPSGEPPTKQTLLSDYGISSSPKTSRVETLGNKHGPLVEVKLEPGVPPKVGKVEEGRRASDEGGKRKLAGCRCGNATLCPGKLTCCGQRCPCYVDNLACTDCKCKGCRNPHRPGGGKVRPTLPFSSNVQVVYPVAKDQQATVRIPVTLANAEMMNLKGINLEKIAKSEKINFKGIDLSQLPILNLDSSSSTSGRARVDGQQQQQQPGNSSTSNMSMSTLSVISLVKGGTGRVAHSK